MSAPATAPPPPDLPQDLLWEFDLATFDYDRAWRIAIERVIERGDLHEWREIRRYYGTRKIVTVATESRQLSRRCREFAFLFVNSKMLDGDHGA